MTRIYPILLALSCILPLAHNLNTKYPNCIKTLQNQQLTNTQINSNKNFISLSQFIMKLDTKTQVYFKQQTNVRIESGYINSQQLSKQSQQQYLMNYFVLFGVCVLFCLFLLFMRTKISYDRTIRNFVSKNMQSAIAPSLVITIIVWVAFLAVFWSYIYKFPIYIDQVQCSQNYLKDLMLYGNNKSNWAGLYGYQKLINHQIQYMKAIQTIPSSYSFQLLPINNRINQRRSITNQFLEQFSNASITYTSTDTDTSTYSINISKLLPKLLSSDKNNRAILNNIDQSLQNLFTISKLFIQVETILNDTELTSNKSRASLTKMLPSYIIPARLIQKSNIFVPFIQITKSDDNQRILDELDRNQYLVFFSTIFLGAGIQLGVSYLCLILISLKIRYHLIIKLTNFLWVLLICLLLLGIAILFLSNTIITQSKFQCAVFEDFLSNKTTFYSYQNIKKPASINAYKIFEPCLFEKYDRYTKQTIIGDFTNFPDFHMQSSAFVSFNTNLTTLIDMMSPTDSASFASPFGYQADIEDAIQYIEDQKSNQDVDGKWDYLNQLLDQLNIYTLNDTFNTQCYKHRWQFTYKNCPKSMNILPLRDNNLIIQAANYSNASPACLILTSDPSQVLSNFKLNQSRCATTCNDIKSTLLKIVQVMQTRDYVLQSITSNLKQIKDQLDQYLRILRTNYVLKKQMLQYVITVERTIPLNAQSIKNWEYLTKKHNNCTCIKIWLDRIYNNTCINMRSDILKTFLILIISLIILGVLLILGFLYGVNQEIKQIQHRDMDNDIMSASRDEVQGAQEILKPTSKFMREFFTEYKKNG